MANIGEEIREIEVEEDLVPFEGEEIVETPIEAPVEEEVMV